MSVDEQQIQIEPPHQGVESVVEKRGIVAIPEHARNIAGVEAGRNYEETRPIAFGQIEISAYVTGRLFNRAAAPEVVVQRTGDHPVKPEQHMHTWRLNIGVDHSNAVPLACRQVGQIRREVRLPCAATKRM